MATKPIVYVRFILDSHLESVQTLFEIPLPSVPRVGEFFNRYPQDMMRSDSKELPIPYLVTKVGINWHEGCNQESYTAVVRPLKGKADKMQFPFLNIDTTTG